MKKLLLILLVTVLVFFFAGCTPDTASEPIDPESPEESVLVELSSQLIASGHYFILQIDPNKEIVSDIPMHYLTIDFGNGESRLLSQSVDRGEDWPNSISRIINPTLSYDKSKIFYSTDNTFTRTSGIGANNYRTRVVDLQNNYQDSYFSEGALHSILDESHSPYQGYVILEIHSLDSAGKATKHYSVYKPNGERIVLLDQSGNWENAIDSALKPPTSISKSEEPTIPIEEADLLRVYETNKEYKLSINLQDKLDSFNVVQTTEELYLIFNHDSIYNFQGIDPMLAHHRYLVNDLFVDDIYMFIFSMANPPSGPDKLHLYVYNPNYEIMYLGYIHIDNSNHIDQLIIDYVNHSQISVDGNIQQIIMP